MREEPMNMLFSFCTSHFSSTPNGEREIPKRFFYKAHCQFKCLLAEIILEYFKKY